MLSNNDFKAVCSVTELAKDLICPGQDFTSFKMRAYSRSRSIVFVPSDRFIPCIYNSNA